MKGTLQAWVDFLISPFQKQAEEKMWQLGPIELAVRDLNSMRKFYEQNLKFAVLQELDQQILLGGKHTFQPLLILKQVPDHQPEVRDKPFHFAFELAEMADFCNFLSTVITEQTLYTKAVDHGYCYSVYLQDPEGNKVEFYCNTPTEEWRYLPLDQLETKQEVLHIRRLLTEARDQVDILPTQTKVGHLHFKCCSISRMEWFYTTILLMDKRSVYGEETVYLSFSNNHHELGFTQTSELAASGGAVENQDGQTLILALLAPSIAATRELAERLENHHIQYQYQDGDLLFKDPGGQLIHVSVDHDID